MGSLEAQVWLIQTWTYFWGAHVIGHPTVLPSASKETAFEEAGTWWPHLFQEKQNNAYDYMSKFKTCARVWPCCHLVRLFERHRNIYHFWVSGVANRKCFPLRGRPKVQSRDMLIQYLSAQPGIPGLNSQDAEICWGKHQLHGSASTSSHSPNPWKAMTAIYIRVLSKKTQRNFNTNWWFIIYQYLSEITISLYIKWA